MRRSEGRVERDEVKEYLRRGKWRGGVMVL
jgi:hypothetical protein